MRGGSERARSPGKLSDFAGLIVAPVLVAAVFPRRWRAARIGAFAWVIVAFCAIKLSATAAHWVEAALSWRIWCDWTDLMALVAVPLAYRISDGTLPSPSVPARWRPALLRVGAFVGAIACVATSSTRTSYRTKAFIVNLAHDSLEVRTWHPSEALDCTASRTDPHDFDASKFGLFRCTTFAPMDVSPLDLGATRTDSAYNQEIPIYPDAGPPRVCDAVLIRIAGAQDTLIYWNAIESVSMSVDVPETTVSQEFASHGVFLETFGDRRLISTGAALQSWKVDWSVPISPLSCEP